MSHKVIILDDEGYMAQAIQWSVESADRDAQCITAHSVEEAKQKLDGHLSEFLYALVDLHMGNRMPRAQQGEAFLEWLSDTGGLQRIAVLVLSSYESRLSNLPGRILRHVQTRTRTASDAEEDLAIRRFVEKAIRQRARPDPAHQ
jgi:hypothetical protein